MFIKHQGNFKSIFSLLIHIIALSASLLATQNALASKCEKEWPAWELFKKTFVSGDGRVVDLSGARKPTVSEGQAYALFFALVANDKPTFQRVLSWTENNLAGGDLTARLPAWQWGQREDNSWGVIDKNSASDADLWLAYTLGAAGNAWKEKRYSAMSSLLAQRILNEETADLPKLGLTLLPAPNGFALSPNTWKLNPSYIPLQLLRWFEFNEKDERWKQIADSSQKIIIGASPKGFTADWTIYDSEKGFLIDSNGAEKGAGGYNAIRVYLWTGMLASRDPDRATLLKILQPMVSLIDNTGYPPEYIDIMTGEVKSPGSSGFSAATLPLLQASGAKKASVQQQLRIQAQPIKSDAYYDQVLSLFAMGWQDKRFRFDAKGSVDLQWRHFCWKLF